MRRIEYWLLGFVAAFIALIGTAVLRERALLPSSLTIAQQGMQHDEDGAGSTGHGAAEEVSSSALGAGADVNGAIRRTGRAAPRRDLAQIRSRLTMGAPGTYILDMLASQDSTLYRWPDRDTNGIKVWVQTEPHVADFWAGYASIVRDVFTEWESTGVPLRFEFAQDSSAADIGIRWIDRFPPAMGRRIGSTRRTSDQNAAIVGAEITVAIHDGNGRTFPPGELTGILRHEIGHALGLGHSTDRATIMYPEESTTDITATDVATIRLLYSLPPGSVK